MTTTCLFRLASMGFLVCICAVAAEAAQEGGDDPPAIRPVKHVRVLKRDAGRVAWSAQGDWLAFDAAGEDSFYDVFVIKADGSLERCLTCPIRDFRKTNNFNPAWHPSGEYLVFQVQGPARRLKLGAEDLATPYRALHSELWAIDSKGRNFWQLTRVNEMGGALLDPHFSHEGHRLLWSERVGTRKGQWGQWIVRVANFRVRTGVPRISKLKSYKPGEQNLFVNAHEFTPNDRGVLLSGNLEAGQSESGMDVYLLDLDSGELTRLTHSRRSWDDFAHHAPQGGTIAWATNSELRLDKAQTPGVLSPALLRDLWLMRVDGSEKRRLTFFNHLSSPESLGSAYVGDFAWSPSGDQIAVHVISSAASEAIYLIQLEESFRRFQD